MKHLIILCSLLLISCGIPGPQGSNGQSASCNVSTITATNNSPGGALISCTDGTSSLVLNGTNGNNGANGNIVQAIQFCPNTTNYPNTFSEVGFCINSQLYAVYSQNDGFLTYVPPGNYYSDGVNSSCNFTVGTDCTITNN